MTAPSVTANGTAEGASVGSLSLTIAPSGSNRVLLASVASRAAAGAQAAIAVGGVTFAGTAMTRLQGALPRGTAAYDLEVWYLVAPPTGSGTLSVTFPATQVRAVLAAAAFQDADQTAPVLGAVRLNSTTVGGVNTLGTNALPTYSGPEDLIYLAAEEDSSSTFVMAGARTTNGGLTELDQRLEASGLLRLCQGTIPGTDSGTLSGYWSSANLALRSTLYAWLRPVGAGSFAADTTYSFGETNTTPWGGIASDQDHRLYHPRAIDLPAGVVATKAFAGRAHAVLLGNDGKVYCFGDNSSGQCGVSTGTATIVRTPHEMGLANIVDVAAGGDSSYAVSATGVVSAWGKNSSGQLGNGGTTSTEVVQTVTPGGETGAKIRAGQDYALLLTASGKAYHTGDSTHGQRGDGTTGATNTAWQDVGLTGVTDIGAGAFHCWAILGSSTTARSWGKNDHGQLGLGGVVTPKTIPQSVSLPGGIAAAKVECGYDFTYLRTVLDDLYACGSSVERAVGTVDITTLGAMTAGGSAQGDVLPLSGLAPAVHVRHPSTGVVYAAGLNTQMQLDPNTFVGAEGGTEAFVAFWSGAAGPVFAGTYAVAATRPGYGAVVYAPDAAPLVTARPYAFAWVIG